MALDASALLPVTLGALSALAGASIGGFVQLRVTDIRVQAEADKSDRADLLNALATLLETTEEALALAEGAVFSGKLTRVDNEKVRRFTHAFARARLLVPPDTWEEMRPYLECVAAKVNSAQFRSWEAEKLVESLGGHTIEGFLALEERALAGARALLDSNRPSSSSRRRLIRQRRFGTLE